MAPSQEKHLTRRSECGYNSAIRCLADWSTLQPGQKCDIWDRTVPICDITHVTDLQAREFLLVRGKGCVVQVRCTGTSLIGLEPVRMKLTISDLDDYERKVKTQKAALALVEQGPVTEIPLWTKTTQIPRDGLVALDCLELGMSRRDIAVVLNGKDVVDAEWSLENGTMKDAIRYIIRKAEGLRDGGYLIELLGAQLGLDQRVDRTCLESSDFQGRMTVFGKLQPDSPGFSKGRSWP